MRVARTPKQVCKFSNAFNVFLPTASNSRRSCCVLRGVCRLEGVVGVCGSGRLAPRDALPV
eukprot:13183771-Alexandrium_andersonii.AAC.1